MNLELTKLRLPFCLIFILAGYTNSCLIESTFNLVIKAKNKPIYKKGNAYM